MTKLTGKVYGHTFVDFKSVEKICWKCGYVTPRCESDRDLKMFICDYGHPQYCPDRWHGVGKKIPPSKQVKRKSNASV